jgi:hypothetical protein
MRNKAPLTSIRDVPRFVASNDSVYSAAPAPSLACCGKLQQYIALQCPRQTYLRAQFSIDFQMPFWEYSASEDEDDDMLAGAFLYRIVAKTGLAFVSDASPCSRERPLRNAMLASAVLCTARSRASPSLCTSPWPAPCCSSYCCLHSALYQNTFAATFIACMS